MFINKQNINLVIKEYEKLIQNSENNIHKENFERMLKSYKAIKNLFDNSD